MQNLQAGAAETTRIRRHETKRPSLENSPSQSRFRTKSLEFIPFLQQRDSMGHLLPVRNSSGLDCMRVFPMLQSKIILEPKKQSNVQETVDKKVHSFFKKIDVQSRELSRSKLVNKKSLVMHELEPKSKRNASLAEWDTTPILDQMRAKFSRAPIKHEESISPVKIKQSSINQFNKTQPSGTYKDIKSLGQFRSQSTIEKNAKTQISPQKMPLRSMKNLEADLQHKKSQSLINSLKVKLNPQLPDYRRYKQQQQMSLKVFPDYDESHEKFRQKMKESKLIAYRIKKELQID